MDKKGGTKKEAADELVSLKIKWRVSEDIITRVATNITLQVVDDMFKVSFFEIKPEIRTDPSDPMPHEVVADCVASIMISASKIEPFAQVFQRQVGKIEKA